MLKYIWFLLVATKEIFIALLAVFLSAHMMTNLFVISSLTATLIFIAVVTIVGTKLLTDSPRERINKYFVAKKLPFSKDRVIFQWVKSTRSENADCQGVINAAIMYTALAMKKLQPGHYRAITHKQIITMLQKNYKNYTIDKIIFLRVKPIKRVVKQIVGSDCKRECHKTCETFNEKKDFFYLEFTVPSKN